MFLSDHLSKIVSEYDQEIPQSQTTDKPHGTARTRSFLAESSENLYEEMSINEIHLLSYLSVSPEKREEIRRATMEDHEMTL